MTVGELSHFQVFSVPRNGVLVLGADAPWPAHYDRRLAILVWSGRASCLYAALNAAF